MRSTTRRSDFSRGTRSCSGRISIEDFALTNVMMYWLTRTGSSAGRLYYENAHAHHDRPTPTTLPLGLAGFGGDFYGLRRFAQRDHANIVHWNTYDHGGHFAAHKVPDCTFLTCGNSFA